MGSYSLLLGRRVDVNYRDGSTKLFAAGTLVADSGDSVSLEDRQSDSAEMLRWKLPYACIICVVESNSAPASGQEPVATATQPPSFRRRSPRVSAAKPVVLSWQEHELEQVEGTVTFSISRFGCALSSRRFFQPGAPVRLEHQGKTIVGRVVYSLKDHSTNFVEVGVAFDQDGGEFWGVVF